MTQDELSGPPPEGLNVSRIYEEARRNSRRLWLISGIWAATLIALGAMFTYSLRGFQETANEIQNLTTDIQHLEVRAKKILADLEQMQQNLGQVQELQKTHTEVYALRLQNEKSKGGSLSAQEEQFLSDVLVQFEQRVPKAKSASDDKIFKKILFLANNAYHKAVRSRMLGKFDESERWFKKSIPYFQRAIILQDDDPSTLFRLAHAQQQAKELRASVRNLQKVIKSYGEDDFRSYDPFKLLGLSLLMFGDYPAALESFGKAVELARKKQEKYGLDQKAVQMQTRRVAGALENIGIVYLHQRDWESALKNTDEVTAISADMTWNWLVRAVAADKLGRQDLANESHKIWLERKGRGDEFHMRSLLPTELKPYVRALP